MWAQLIKVQLKAGCEGELPRLEDELRKTEQPGSGLVRSIMMQDQKNASQAYMLIVFESEEQARARESDPRREEGLLAARAIMAEIFEGAPEFVDLTVVEEFAP